MNEHEAKIERINGVLLLNYALCALDSGFDPVADEYKGLHADDVRFHSLECIDKILTGGASK